MKTARTLLAALLLALGCVTTPDAAEESGQPVNTSSDKPGQVLNQQPPQEPTIPEAEEKKHQEEAQTNGGKPKTINDAQKVFEESLRQMMPLDNGQIQKFRERSDERDKALLPVAPTLGSRTVRVALEPGHTPVPVYTTANVATSLVFHDVTGQPWPITSVTNGGPTFFQVLRPELPDGNLLNVMPAQGYATSTLVVTLEKRDVPLVIRLESDSVRAPERKADALVLFQLAHHGPRASIPIIKDIKETADSTMLAFLDRVPPKDSVRLLADPGGEDFMGWAYNGKHYLRTNQMLVWPAWSAVVNGAGNTKCYEVEPTSRVMVSKDGEIHTIKLRKGK